MHVVVNGERRAVPDNSNLLELVATLDLPLQRIAIELNGEVVRKKDWPTTMIKDNDRIEVVHFVGGG